MAVHLNARLKTRFIPFLFTAAILVSVLAMLAHASDGVPDSDEAAPAVSREELRTIMSESVDSERLDRRPGFSPVVFAPRPGERPTTGPLSAQQAPQNAEEPLPVGSGSSQAYLDFSDSLPAQPAEALPDQR